LLRLATLDSRLLNGALKMARYDLSEAEWRLIEPLLPNKPRGVARVDDRRVINGIFYVLRTGSPWRDLPERYGPYTTVYNRFNRWAKAGIWLKVFETLAARSPQSMQLIDSSIIRAHQHAAGGKKGARITPSAVLVED
jgi:transposase